MKPFVSGPWKVSTLRPGGNLYIENSQGYVLAQVEAMLAYKSRHEANARLMAAAPVMHGALVKALACITHSDEYRVGNPAYEQAEAAIVNALRDATS